MPLLSHSQKRYELRLLDEALLVFTAARDAFGTVSVSVDEVVTTNLHLLPLSLWPDSRSGERLLSWLETRVIPKNRRFVDQILAQAVVTDDSTFGILDVCLGLSVNNAYWVVPHSFEGTWADYNLFENDLDEVLALVALRVTPQARGIMRGSRANGRPTVSFLRRGAAWTESFASTKEAPRALRTPAWSPTPSSLRRRLQRPLRTTR